MASTSPRRSDEIRRRRSKRVQKPARNSRRRRKNDFTTRSMPPVLARSGMVDSDQIRERRSGKIRPRLDLPLNSDGVEMRLPAIPHIRIGWRLVSFVLSVSMFYLLYTFWNSPGYRVETVDITGLSLLDSSTVRSYINADGQQIYLLDSLSKEQDLLSAFPEFSKVDFQILMPNTVLVTVTERLPVLLWRQDGRSSLVDIEGIIFPMREETLGSLYPVVEADSAPPSLIIPTFISSEKEPASEEGDVVEEGAEEFQNDQPFMAKEMVAAVLEMVQLAPDGATLTYDTHHGLGWKDPRGWVVYFGEFSLMKAKLQVYEAILQYLRSQDTRPTLISVEFLHAPYYRLTD